MKKYNPKAIEKKWQKYWDENQTFKVTEDPNKQKFFSLIEFPYPSGAGLHVGHIRPFTAMDVISRKKRMEGYNVLYPIGFDAFGLPTENYAIKTGRPPEEVTAENIATFTRQLKASGFSFDWSRSIDTTDPKYYKWTQWIFLQLFKHGLAYKKNQPINWCPKDKIGLANEEVVGGCCERCGTQVEKRNKEQWMLKITEYADKLLEGLKDVDYIPQAKQQQENWIGRSEGAIVYFTLSNVISDGRFESVSIDKVDVFTTRPDTIFGVTFLATSVEHAESWINAGWKASEEIKQYITHVLSERKIATAREDQEKTGIDTGIKAINPINGEEIPVWITNYVMGDVGTGTIMGVPAHDERDFDFAEKYNLPVKPVVAKHFIETENPPRADKPTVRRRTVHAIVRRKSDGAVLMLKWKANQRPDGKFPYTFIIGGIDKGEDKVVAAKRELQEETGLTNVEFIREFPLSIHTEYFAGHKDENRYSEINVLHFETEGNEEFNIAREELEKHEPLWVPERDVEKTINVVDGPYIWRQFKKTVAMTDSGTVVNSDFLNGLKSDDAKEKIIAYLEEKGLGWKKVQYKLRDWVFSRQRYWGEPIPLVYCEKCAERGYRYNEDFTDDQGEDWSRGWVPIPEDQLPLTLPKVEKYEPTDTGESPLSKIEEWVNVPCPECEKRSKGPKYLIFDFDGVIGDTFEATLRAHVAMGDAADREGALAKLHKYFNGKRSKPRDHMYSDEEMAERQEWARTFGEHMSKDSWELFIEFIEEVKKVENTKIAIVSTGSKLYVEEGAKRSGLNATHVLTQEDHHSKEEKIAMICKEWGVTEKDVYYFTDTKIDVYELENFLDRKKIIGCTWGFLGYDKLREVLPENQILKNFTDLHTLFEPSMARRETDTMPNWAGSSWYFLRYTDPNNDKEFASQENLNYWLGSPKPGQGGVDWYNGGMEHTVLHLLYSRFWNQFLYDIGVVPTREPYKKRTSHGMILAKGGEKMSKSKGNVVNPDEVIEQYGADTLRTYIMFMGPFDQAVEWDTNGLVGVRRFLERVWNLQEKITSRDKSLTPDNIIHASSKNEAIIHRTIKKVSEDISAMRFNTAIAGLMELTNELGKEEFIADEHYEILLHLLAPFAPHMCSELWESLENTTSIDATWPEFNPELIKTSTIDLVVQVNGKVRDTITVSAEIEEEEAKKVALSSEKVQKWMEGKEPKKVIYVKGKLVSIVI